MGKKVRMFGVDVKTAVGTERFVVPALSKENAAESVQSRLEGRDYIVNTDYLKFHEFRVEREIIDEDPGLSYGRFIFVTEVDGQVYSYDSLGTTPESKYLLEDLSGKLKEAEKKEIDEHCRSLYGEAAIDYYDD